MSRIVTRNINAKIPKYTQGYFLCNFSRSFLVEKCQDSSGTERSLKIQLTNQGETIEDFSDFHAGLGIFIADGFNIAWYRNPSPYDIDFSALISQDVLQSSNIFGNVKIENPRDYSQNVNGDPIPLYVSTISPKSTPETIEEIVLKNGNIVSVNNIFNTRIRIEAGKSEFQESISGHPYSYLKGLEIEDYFKASLILKNTAFVQELIIESDYCALYNGIRTTNLQQFYTTENNGAKSIGWPFSLDGYVNGFKCLNTFVKAGEQIDFIGYNLNGVFYPIFKGDLWV